MDKYRPVVPETPASIAAARQQQRQDRCEAIAAADDAQHSYNARMVIVQLCEEWGADRVHSWVRTQGLIQDGQNYCEGRR